MDDYLVGIDFGACNIKAVAFKKNKFIPVRLQRTDLGGDEIPNVIYYNKTEKDEIDTIIGQVAFNRAIADPQNGIDDVKNKLKLENWSTYIQNLKQDVSASKAATDIFACVRSRLQADKDQNIRAALTVPVSFSEVQRQTLRQAAEDAGIVVDCIVTEPFAALFACKDLKDLAQGQKPGLVVTFDFGGSTLDVSIVRIENDEANEHLSITELVAGGIALGGMNIDTAILEKILRPRYAEELNNAFPHDPPDVSNKKILWDVERMKRELFGDDEEEVERVLGTNIITLRREDVTTLLEQEDFKGRIVKLLDDLFQDLAEGADGYGKEDVTCVLPFGGTSKISPFMQLLSEYFGKDIFDDTQFQFEDISMLSDGIEDRFMSVAGGAVRYMKYFHDGGKEISIKNVIPFRIGYELTNGRFQECVAKNKPYGFEPLRKLLKIEALEAEDWKLSVFQSFSLASDASAIYMGKIALDKSLYDPNKSVLVQMCMVQDGRLRLQFFQEDADREINIIEELFLKIGG